MTLAGTLVCPARRPERSVARRSRLGAARPRPAHPPAAPMPVTLVPGPELGRRAPRAEPSRSRCRAARRRSRHRTGGEVVIGPTGRPGASRRHRGCAGHRPETMYAPTLTAGLGDPQAVNADVPLAAAERLAAGSGQVGHRLRVRVGAASRRWSNCGACLRPGQGKDIEGQRSRPGAGPGYFSRLGTRRWLYVREGRERGSIMNTSPTPRGPGSVPGRRTSGRVTGTFTRRYVDSVDLRSSSVTGGRRTRATLRARLAPSLVPPRACWCRCWPGTLRRRGRRVASGCRTAPRRLRAPAPRPATWSS